MLLTRVTLSILVFESMDKRKKNRNCLPMPNAFKRYLQSECIISLQLPFPSFHVFLFYFGVLSLRIFQVIKGLAFTV